MNRSSRVGLAMALAAAFGTAQAADPAQISTKAGCAVCHAADRKLVGPSWKEVAGALQGQCRGTGAAGRARAQGQHRHLGQGADGADGRQGASAMPT